MVFNVFALWTGSVSLAKCPLPIFVCAHAASDALLLLLDNHLPDVLLQVSLSIKLFTTLLVLLYANTSVLVTDASSPVTSYLCSFMIFHGLHRCVQYWYTSATWPQANLNRAERQFLNDFFAVVMLIPVALLRGHHQSIYDEFPHLYSTGFYALFILSGILSWLSRTQLDLLDTRVLKWHCDMVRLLAKMVVTVAALNFYWYPNVMLMWLCVLMYVGGEVMFVFASMLEQEQYHHHHDVQSLNKVLIAGGI